MTMHLAHPSLSLTGKKKGKMKFKSAEQKRAYERLAEEWSSIKKSHGVREEEKKRARAMAAEPLSKSYTLSAPPGRGSTAHIPSRDTGGNATLAAPKVYTGTKVKGIATMHKSNAVPVFSDEEAIEISRMRRG
jgi:hypothetical protein